MLYVSTNFTVILTPLADKTKLQLQVFILGRYGILLLYNAY